MGNKKATGFLCLQLVPCFAYVGAEDNRKGIPFVKIVSLLCKLIQFLMVALSVTVHKALILLVFLNHPYQSLAFIRLLGFIILFKLNDCISVSTISCCFDSIKSTIFIHIIQAIFFYQKYLGQKLVTLLC